jgi:23S rRNA (adenine1618-N6)-methyltransferase
MSAPKKKKATVKHQLHPRNKHRENYDFDQLMEVCPALANFVQPNKYQQASINFFDTQAVRMLNKALLKLHYGIDHWELPEKYLCPPIPGRADYLHYITDLLASCNGGKVPRGENFRCVDIGTGASGIYALLGNSMYGWHFIGSDIDPVSLEAAQKIVDANPQLEGKIDLRHQVDKRRFLEGLLKKNEVIDLTICNPPFHASATEARAATQRKFKNLKHSKDGKLKSNFGGQRNELWYKGGELAFIQAMIEESKQFATSCFWFSTLVSKEANLPDIYDALKSQKASRVETLAMSQGQKKSRIVAWTFLDDKQQLAWAKSRWA